MKFIALPRRTRIGTATSQDSSNRTSQSPTAKVDLPREDDSRQPNSKPSPGGYGEPGAEADSGKDNPGNQDNSATDRRIQQSGENGGNGGAAHGIGADPDSLFGAPAASKLGSEGFEIAIEAQPVDHGAKGAGHAYVAPKVRAPLSLNQEPDEPVARAAVRLKIELLSNGYSKDERRAGGNARRWRISPGRFGVSRPRSTS